MKLLIAIEENQYRLFSFIAIIKDSRIEKKFPFSCKLSLSREYRTITFTWKGIRVCHGHDFPEEYQHRLTIERMIQCLYISNRIFLSNYLSKFDDKNRLKVRYKRASIKISAESYLASLFERNDQIYL